MDLLESGVVQVRISFNLFVADLSSQAAVLGSVITQGVQHLIPRSRQPEVHRMVWQTHRCATVNLHQQTISSQGWNRQSLGQWCDKIPSASSRKWVAAKSRLLSPHLLPLRRGGLSRDRGSREHMTGHENPMMPHHTAKFSPSPPTGLKEQESAATERGDNPSRTIILVGL